ncbi:MAG: hypothetical protein OK457_02280 [Thaumarchaeota archaeon]|jgi:hypothetical protein|nr:hypothetical protein [Nitrososphaerota archaeon]
MSIDEKIKLGLLALSVVSAIAVAAHFGHVEIPKHPLLDVIGPGGSH